MSAGAGRVVPEDRWADPPVDGPETLAEERLPAVLGRRAAAANPDRVVRLAALPDRGETVVLDEAGRREAEGVAHQVVGSAGTCGHPAAPLARLTAELGG